MILNFKYYFLLFTILNWNVFKAQTIRLKIESVNHSKLIEKLNYKSSHTSHLSAYKEINKMLASLHTQGYLLAQADTLIQDSSSIVARISKGELFKTAQIKFGNLNPNLASKIGIKPSTLSNKAFNIREFQNYFEKILMYYENNGFPFASVKLDSVRISTSLNTTSLNTTQLNASTSLSMTESKDSTSLNASTSLSNTNNTTSFISASLNIQKNKFFKLDSIKIIGNAKINKSFLNQYLSITEGMPYDESVFKQISKKINQLAFFNQTQNERVQLTERLNKLILFLDKKNASQFDGIVGFLPDAATKKTIVTGDLKLKVVNGILKNGETFDLEWRRLKSQTQDFNGKVIYPYLLNTPLGVDYNLKIYRRDTTFVDINNNIGLHYYFSGLNYFKIFYKQRNNNLISTAGYDFVNTLPDYADVASKAYGIGVFFENLDYKFNPKKGISITINSQVGSREIKQNPKINAKAYENILLHSAQYQIEGNATIFIQLKKNNVLRLAMQGASVFGNSTIYKNELFRIGGLKTLRGFDEESIFTSTYLISTIEYRFLYAKNSNMFLFTEGAWYENLSNHTYKKDTPISFGAGINFETKAGILNLNYALGNQLGNGFDVRSGKIHFGLTSLF